MTECKKEIEGDVQMANKMDDFVSQRLAQLRLANAYPRPKQPPRTAADVRLERIPDVRGFGVRSSYEKDGRGR